MSTKELSAEWRTNISGEYYKFKDATELRGLGTGVYIPFSKNSLSNR